MSRSVSGLLRRYRLIAASSLTLGAGILAIAAWQQVSAHAEAPTAAPEVKFVKVERVSPRAMADERRAVGEIRPRRETDVGFRVSGKLVERLVEIGQTVAKGDLLARVEDQDYRNRLLSAEADRAAAEAVLVEARASEQRSRVLLEKGYTTRANHDATLKNLRSAETKLLSANIALAMASDQLAYTELHADFAGVVTAIAAEPGQIVNAGQMVVRLADPADRDAVFAIAEANFAGEGPGKLQAIEVSLLSNPAITASGRLREVAPVADAATGTYQVKVTLDDIPVQMRFGAAVAGRVALTSEPMVVLPSAALFDKDGAPAVWIVNAQSRVELKSVGVARFEADRVLVDAGLAEGDLVVTVGVNRLRESQHVRFEEGEAK